MEVLLAITGASGSIYAASLLAALSQRGVNVDLVLTPAAQIVIRQELNWDLEGSSEVIQEKLVHYLKQPLPGLKVLAIDNWFNRAASGSNPVDAMVAIPCSMGTLSAIAHGLSQNLIERAADVLLKERRKLILMPRETPLSTLHLDNMLKISQLGGIIMPAMPGFYHRPQRISDLVDFMISRVLAHLGLDNSSFKRWGQGG